MEFFIPEARDDAEAEEVHAAIVAFARENVGSVSGRRIYRLTFRHNGVRQEAEVGQRFEPTGERVIAILEGVTYFVCTPTRGVRCGTPVLVGRDEVVSIEDFAPRPGGSEELSTNDPSP